MSMNDPRATLARFHSFIDAARPDAATALLDDAVEAAVDAGAFATATSLATQSVAPLVAADRWRGALKIVDRVLEVVDATEHPVLRGRLLAARSGLLRTPRRYVEALENQADAIALLEGRASEVELTTLRHDRAVLLADVGHADEAVAGLVAAREAFLGMRDQVGVAASDHNLGFVLHDLGALDDAIEYLTEARDIFLAIDMPEEAASCDQNLGVIFYDANRLTDAGRRFAVARHRFVECDAHRSAAECDANVSTLLTTMGRPDEAVRYRRRAEAVGVGLPTAPGTSTQTDAVPPITPVSDQPDGTLGSASA